MKVHLFSIGFITLFGLSLLVALMSLTAEVKEKEFERKNPVEFEIKGSSRSVEIREVTYREEGTRVDGVRKDQEQKWVRIHLEYDLKIQDKYVVPRDIHSENYWLDQCTFSWVVVVPRTSHPGASRGFSPSLRLKKSVTYRNIEAGRRQHVVLYIDPRVWRRYRYNHYREHMYISLEIRSKGKTLTQLWIMKKGSGVNYTTKKDKWDEAMEREHRVLLKELSEFNWFTSDKIRDLDYGLLSRRETPWAWASESHYQDVMQK